MPYTASEQRYDEMKYVRSGKSGIRLPQIALGLWQNFGGNRTLDIQEEMILRAFDLGINHFDLANNYGPPPGSAEENFGVIYKNICVLTGMNCSSPRRQATICGVDLTANGAPAKT